jgi:hypothetical protein|tara:strand:- start:1739 stop:1972 length:234 start_codon:yes stop_codon:yes gene_type:complete
MSINFSINKLSQEIVYLNDSVSRLAISVGQIDHSIHDGMIPLVEVIERLTIGMNNNTAFLRDAIDNLAEDIKDAKLC